MIGKTVENTRVIASTATAARNLPTTTDVIDTGAVIHSWSDLFLRFAHSSRIVRIGTRMMKIIVMLESTGRSWRGATRRSYCR